MNWTDSATAVAGQMWLEGSSAATIGALFGCSRNAVIGKIHRMGFRRSQMRERRAVATKSLPGAPSLLEPLTLHTNIVAAAAGQCRYINDSGADAPICGREAVGAWCPAHRRLVYAPTRRIGNYTGFAAWRDSLGQFRVPGSPL